MKLDPPAVFFLGLAVAGGMMLSLAARAQEGPPFGAAGPRGFGPGGPGGPRQQTKLVERFDTDGDHRLNREERQAARAALAKERAAAAGRRGPFGPGGRRGGFGRPRDTQPPQPGPKLTPADVPAFPDAPMYDLATLRTFFLEFEAADWEQELADFIDTDVEVPVTLTVDGRTYSDVGVHFRGMSSLMMIGAGQKRSLNLSLDFVHQDQRLGGYRTLNLLNAHEDPTFLRSVLYYRIAREYLPAPQANFVRLVINGESWGVYVNVQQFNKDFLQEWFGTTKGARWKTPGSPRGRASLAYLGDDPAAYRGIYEIKSKDDPQSWAALIRLCKVLNQTPADQLEAVLAPLLDIDGALRFLALENALINNDGYWTRTSDYSLYLDPNGQFHVIPYDANETFTRPGGPGFGGRGGPARFGPAGLLAPQILAQADQDGDAKLTRAELAALADAWFKRLDPDQRGQVNEDQFADKLAELLPPPPGFGPPGGGRGPADGPGAFSPPRLFGPALFTALDANHDAALTPAELQQTFANWFGRWEAGQTGTLTEDQLRAGLAEVLPRPEFAGPPGEPRGPGGARGPGERPFGDAPRIEGVQLDPLIAANDPDKPLISKLLAVPTLRQRYLAYVRDIAETWLDWARLGPIAQQCHDLIAADVQADTRKLDSTEAFEKGLLEDTGGEGFGPFGRGHIGLKNFADQRRAYLLNHPAVQSAAR
jgi:hypothetical protein